MATRSVKMIPFLGHSGRVSCARGSCVVREPLALDDARDVHRAATSIPNGALVRVLGRATGTIRYGGLPVGPRPFVRIRWTSPTGAVVDGWLLQENVR